MTTLSEAAKAYEPPKRTHNIAELEAVPIHEVTLKKDSFEYEGETIVQDVIEFAGIKYRVPASVLEQIKDQVESNPELKYIRVKKKGTTKEDTKYTVIPLPTVPQETEVQSGNKIEASNN